MAAKSWTDAVVAGAEGAAHRVMGCPEEGAVDIVFGMVDMGTLAAEAG